jgi:hypothetical protein
MLLDQVALSHKWLRQQSEDFHAEGFDALVKRWDKCINVSLCLLSLLIKFLAGSPCAFADRHQDVFRQMFDGLVQPGPVGVYRGLHFF